MSSPSGTTNDMYEEIREGTSGTRNEGNNYNILLTYIENIKIELYLSISLVFGNYKRCTRLATASDKVYQFLAHGRWFSPLIWLLPSLKLVIMI
jgi:hypothetical protein